MQGLDKINWSQTSAVNSRQPERIAGNYTPQKKPVEPNPLQARLEAIGTGELSPKGNSVELDYYA